MSVLMLDPPIDEVEELEEMGSYNHSKIQANLAFLFKRLGTYAVFTELSLALNQLDLSRFNLKTKDEIKPDVCIYPKRGLSRPDDILKMAEAPLLVVEILSPQQDAYEIIEKFKVYFALGVQSCWFIDPVLEAVAVYATITERTTFSETDIVDTTLDIHMSLREVFD